MLKVGVYATLPAVFLLFVFVAESKIELTLEKETIHVFPGEITSSHWTNRDELFVQDVDEFALYQNFSKRNSSYIGSDPEIVTPGRIIETENVSAPLETATENILQTESATTTGVTEASVGVISDEEASGLDADDVIVEMTSEEVVDESVLENTEEDVGVVSDEVGFEVVTETVLMFFGKITSVFPFVQGGTSTPIDTLLEEVTEDDIIVEDLSEDDGFEQSEIPADGQVSDEISSSTDNILVESDISTSTTAIDDVEQHDSDITESSTVDDKEVVLRHPISFSNFGIPDLASGQFITNVQLRMSLGAKLVEIASTSLPSFEVEYKLFEDEWFSAGTILVEDEVSNALNGGYFLFALPTILSAEDLARLEVRVTLSGDIEDFDDAYIDSVWLEIDSEVFDRQLLKDRINIGVLETLKNPRVFDFIGEQKDFGRNENPVFTLKYNSQRNVAVRFVRSVFGRELAELEKIDFVHSGNGPVGVSPIVDVTPEGLVTLQLTEEDKKKMHPGMYSVDITVAEGNKIFTDSFDFQWGMLAVNPDQTEYEIGGTADISLGALTPNGNTLCNADLKLYIIDPMDFMHKVPVQTSGVCNGNNVIDVPDYSSIFIPESTGVYEMYVERVGQSGEVISHTSDTFEVVENHPVSLQRVGPTRIYPVAEYPMEIIVTAGDAFAGTLTEKVPGDFVISSTTADIRKENGEHILSWDIDLSDGSSTTLSYTFDAPDISPFLYKLGPAELLQKKKTKKPSIATATSTGATTVSSTGGGLSGHDFVEHREWQVASDATGNMIIFWDNGASIPTDWTCLSCGSGTFYQQFIRGDATYNTSGGSATHTHTADTSILTSADTALENRSGSTVAADSHTHTLAATISTESNLPEYSDLRVLQYNSAGEPPTIPSGAIVVFDSTVPTGWTQYSTQDGKYVQGEDVPGTTGGSNEHAHDVTGTTGAASGGTYGVRGGGTQASGATAAHTHTISTSTATSSKEPAYIEVIFGQVGSATTTPDGMISMWTDTPPGGWTNLSAQSGDPFYQRFVKGSTTYGGTGGADTHNEGDEAGIVSSVPSATASGRTGSAGTSDTHTHVVDVTNFSTENHLPPYITAIFAKRLGVDPAYDQLSYRWFANEDAEPPTDPWAAGVAIDLSEGVPIDSASIPVADGDVLRLKMNALVTNATSTVGADDFKLQYGAGDTCAAVSWSDVGASGSGEIWRGYNNASVTDGADVSSTTLASSTVFASYSEEGAATTTSNEIGVDEVAEWDFVIENNGANAGTNYCFRMVLGDGSTFFAYTSYPELLTNSAPDAADLSVLFDNEKVASTTPWFEFDATDPEGDDVEYQIQIDDTYAFSSTVVNETSDVSTDFENLVTVTDKSPYNSGELIRFIPDSALTNGTTYYWRVRARDIEASNTWGDWSTIQSFTIDTALTASAWFQTTEEQFDTNTLVDLDALVTDELELASGSTTGSMASQSIDFDQGALGTAWGSLSWNDTETVGDIKYQIEYNNNDTWTLVPDSELSSNSTGYDTSPINLLSLDTNTYNEIRIVANFTDSGGTPSLQDITLEWGYRVAVPVISKLFSNEQVATTTPTLEFTTTDPQDDDLTYQVQWSLDYDFTASTTRTSDVDLGFANITTGISDTDPFISGDTIQFTIQGADALADGSTYWWRVRAKDPLDADAYSFWTTPRAFTISSTTVVSTWFQTTDEQFDTDILAGTQTFGSDSLRVATTASEAMMVYGEGIVQTPRYRTWDGSDWSAESSLPSIDASVSWVRGRAATTREEYVVATVGTDGDVNAQVYAIGIWQDQQEVTAAIGDVNARGMDVAYETLSGDAMVVACNSAADPVYYIWDGDTWTSGGSVNMTSANDCAWLQLASDPLSDEIILLARDDAGSSYEALVWDGAAWGDSTTQGSITESAHEGMALAYEDEGGQAVIVTSDGNPGRMRWNSWDGAAWGTAATQALGDDFEWGYLVADNGSEEMALCYQDEDLDIGMVLWTGSAWTGQTELTADGNAKTDPAFSCVFEDVGSRDNYIMTAYSDTGATNYSFWDNSAWATEAAINSIPDASTMELQRTGVGVILGTFFDDVNDSLFSSSWDGTTWSTTTTIEDDASDDATPFGHPYTVIPRNPGSEGTVAESPPIEFADGVGPYWEEVSWNDSEPGTSEILYQIEYQTAPDTWVLISDSDIPGNSVGTSTSPIDLSSLNIVTHDILRVRATLSCDGSGNCPQIHDWTVIWAEGITVSGNIHQYDQMSSTTSGTVAVAVNGVLQIGKTGSISNGVWSIDNVTTFPDDVVTVFVSGAADTNEAVGVTVYDGLGDITGFDLYERHLTIGSDDNATVRNIDVGLYKNSDDEDLFHDVNANNDLDVCVTTGCSDVELFVHIGNIFQPGADGAVFAHDVEINGTLLANGNTIYVGGSWDNNATATMATSTVIFSATSTSEIIDQTGAVSSVFNNLTFGSSTSSGDWSLVTPLDVNGDLAVTEGTLARTTTAITVAGDLTTGANGLWSGIGTTTFDGNVASTWSDAHVTSENVGNVVIDGTSKTVTLAGNVGAESITIGADDILDASASNYDITVYGNWINNNTFTARSGEVIFTATSTGKIITAGNDSFYDLTFSGAGGAWSFTEADLGVGNDFSVSTGTVTMPTGTTTLAGSFSSVGGTFAHNNAVIYLTSSGSETITASGTPFTNNFYDLNFNGSGSWAFLDTNTTTSNNFIIQQGSVTMPSDTLTVGASFGNTAGTFTHNSGTVKFTSSAAETISANSSFNNLLFTGSGSWTLSDATVTAVGDVTVDIGTLTLPSSQLTIGGSFTNNATLTHNSGSVLFNSSDSGEVIDLGASSLYDVTINSATGGWTISDHATTTNTFTLTAGSDFTLASGSTLSVGSTFTNSIGGASTTWTGSTLSLESGEYTINAKTDAGDAYDTLRVQANTDVSMWNSIASTYVIDATGSLYSQDHNAVDGDLYIFGDYARTSGTEYWSYATDFDGTDLSGGSERQANVRLADGATVTLSDSLFEVTGTSTASTTVANQGSGTYTVSVSGGTTTAQYYDFDDLGASGLSLLASTTVTSLGDGGFTVASAAGTGLTLSSTTIDASPALQIYRVTFATTTPIAATNIRQTDGVPASYWWFRDSFGNIDGEANDNDTGDPGSVRWDDSSLVITISGTVYNNDEFSPLLTSTCGVGTPVRVVVEDGSTYDGACSGVDGSYSVGGVVVVGDPTLTVFLNDANNGEQAVAVTKTPTADISDMDLYVNRVIVRHEDISAMTIEDMAAYDHTDDTDVQFFAATSTTDTLSVLSNNELHVWATTTFTPGGEVTLNANATGNTYDGSLHIGDGATFTGAGTTTYRIGGSMTLENGATFVPASTTVIMTATTTGKTIATESDETLALNELQFTGIGGGWNINGNISTTDDIYVATGTVTGTGDITVTSGSFYGNGLVSFGAGTTTINETNTLGGTQSWTLYDLTLGDGMTTGTTTPGSNATTSVDGVFTISTGHFLDAGSSAWDLGGTGTVFVEDGTFLYDTSTVRYSGIAATDILSTNYYNLVFDAFVGSPTYTATGLGVQVFGNLVVGNTAATTVNFDTNDSALNIEGDMIIGALGTFIASDSGSFTAAGSYDNDGTFTASGGTLTFDGTGVHTISAGNSSFSTAVINGVGDFTIDEHATATVAFTITAADDFNIASGQSLAVGGIFANSLGGVDTNWSGSTLYLYGGGNYEINASTTNDTYDTLLIGADTNIRMWNSVATTTTVSGTGSLYSQDHDQIDGDLYIFGSYPKLSGTDHWSYATDFDGTDLSSGSERKVDVYFASSASALFTGGALSVIGDESASTTIQNQGSGTYSVRIGGTASTTWSYYEMRDMDAAGLTFSGAPNVANLSNGDYLITAAGGSGVTVGGSVIDTNPAKTFTQNIFATSSVISANNVTATGTSVSSWRFTNHTGNIAGESFDVDPDGDPGYVVWDDSAASITISGNVYSDEGSTVSGVCDGVTNNVHLRMVGATSYTTTCDGGTGAYSISSVSYSPGDSFVVYIDGETEQAATISEDPISSIGNMDLYENRVIVRHEGVDTLSIADMAIWDSSDDVDIPFTAVDGGTDTLTLPADTKLIVWTNKDFEPGGDVTLSGGGAGAAHDGTLELYDGATFDATGSESHSIGGSFISGSGATFDAETSSLTFTTAGASRTIDTNDDAFYDVIFNGSGSWSIANNTLDVGNDFTITAGAVTLPTGTTTVTGTFNNTGGSFDYNSGQILFDSSAAESVRIGGSALGTTTFNGSGSWTYLDTNATSTGDFTILSGTVTAPSGTLAVSGDFVNEDTFTHNSGLIHLTSSDTAALLTAGGSDLYGVTIAGSGTYTMTDTNVALLDTLAIDSGSITLATGTLSIAGSLLNNGGSFEHGSGTILFNSGDTGEIINPGGSEFYAVSLAAPSGGYTMTGSATTTSNFSLTSASDFTLSSGEVLRVEGVFTNAVGGSATTWLGSTLSIESGTAYSINAKATGGDQYDTFVVGANTDLRAWNSAATTTVVDTSSSFYSQDNAAVDGELYVYGDYGRDTGSDYWSYATDFDGTDLSGGSERVVDVYMASSATTTFTGGTLEILGADAATSTVQNQGSGTYTMDMLGGTFYASYYAFRNLDADGLNLAGTTTVTSLSNGDFELDVASGSLVTVSSTTVNQNASMVITDVRFATTTAITGTNVELVGATPAAWTFVSHRGNLDGEIYDIDGGTECGSIRWDDSSCLLTQQSAYRWRNDDGGEGVPDSEWFDTDWSKRARVTLENVDGATYTDAVIEIPVTYDSDMQADFDDLRFTDESGTTTLDYVIETYAASTDAVVWVKVPVLTGSDETDIYMYYGNGGAADAGVGTATFLTYDDFEDGNITEYSGDTSLFVNGTTNVYQGTYSLDANDPTDRTTDGIYTAASTTEQGQAVRFFQYVDTSAGSGDETCALFGVQDPGSANNNYAVCLEQFGVDRVSISKDVFDNDTNGTLLSSTTISYITGWYEIEVDWDTDDSIYVSVYKDDVLVATTTATDSSYTEGAIGFTYWFQNGGWDFYTSRPLLANEPVVSFGFEQVSGGATWLAELNTAAPNIVVDTVVRPRFLVENTGLSVTDQYQLEFAEKGVAPSCESVSAGSYSAVPPQASCSGSAICMQSSTEFINRASTTDVLGGDGTFTYGQIVEDPSNDSQSVTVEANEYTELEYAIVATNDATDSNYCLRVTDGGTDLDSYLRVAELQLLFAPNITALSLNGGLDITLTAGATTTVYATGTVSDLNGYADLSIATSTIFRSGVGETCTADTNNCYISSAPQCVFESCSGNSCDISCTADIFYHAEPTDAGAFGGQTWRALVEVSDLGGATASATAPSIDLLTLRAISIDNAIDYGTLSVNDDTGSYNATTTIENIGNDYIDIAVEGTNLTDSGSSVIPVTEQIFATSTFNYSACTVCTSLSASAANYEVDLTKPTSSSTAITDDVYWGINIPFGVAGTAHQGNNIFYVIGD